MEPYITLPQGHQEMLAQIRQLFPEHHQKSIIEFKWNIPEKEFLDIYPERINQFRIGLPKNYRVINLMEQPDGLKIFAELVQKATLHSNEEYRKLAISLWGRFGGRDPHQTWFECKSLDQGIEVLFKKITERTQIPPIEEDTPDGLLKSVAGGINWQMPPLILKSNQISDGPMYFSNMFLYVEEKNKFLSFLNWYQQIPEEA